MPPQGVPYKAFAEATFGGPEVVAGMIDRVTEVGRGVGIEFDFDAMPKAPNTRLAHAAVLSYDGDPRQRDVLLRLYAAYFEQGLDITDREVLAAAIAEVTGEAVDEIHPRLDDHAPLDADLRGGARARGRRGAVVRRRRGRRRRTSPSASRPRRSPCPARSRRGPSPTCSSRRASAPEPDRRSPAGLCNWSRSTRGMEPVPPCCRRALLASDHEDTRPSTTGRVPSRSEHVQTGGT